MCQLQGIAVSRVCVCVCVCCQGGLVSVWLCSGDYRPSLGGRNISNLFQQIKRVLAASSQLYLRQVHHVH